MTTHTTTQIHLTARDQLRTWLAQRDPIALLFLFLALLITVALLRPHAQPTIASVAPTAQLPIIMIATAHPELPPTPAPAAAVSAVLPNTLARAVVAYDAPEGRVIGAIERGRSYALLARSGVDWLQADVSGSGVVWLRSADVFDLPTDLADLAPTLAPEVIYQVVSQQPEAPTLTTDERAAALLREFGSEDITGGAALAAHQARENAYAAGQQAQIAPVPPPLTSADLPCHCP